MNSTSSYGFKTGSSVKKAIVIIAAFCMIATIIPMVDATDDSDLQSAINNTADNGTLALDKSYTITSTIVINKSITINGNGNTITYDGNQSAVKIESGSKIVLNNVKITAASNGAYGISITSNVSDVTISNSTINANNRGISFYPVDGCSGKTLTIDNTDILNSTISNYDTKTTVGDTRGIALYGVTGSDIKIINSSNIKGFGYSVNMSNDLVNGVRAGGNTYTVTNSNITGWSAFNVWTIENTFNITNSTLKGISNLNGADNNFATFVINNGIYNGDSNNKNVVNIRGGSVEAYASGTAQQSDFLESSEEITEFNFYKYMLFQKVQLKFPSNSSTFAVSFPGTTVNYTGMNNVTVSYT